MSAVWMSSVSRSLCVAWTRTWSRSHDRTTTSPALLLSTSRVPLVTSTVWSVRGLPSGPPGRAWIGGGCCASAERSCASAGSAASRTPATMLIHDLRIIEISLRQCLRCLKCLTCLKCFVPKCPCCPGCLHRSTSTLLIAGDRRGAAQQLDLAAPRVGEVRIEERVRRVGVERLRACRMASSMTVRLRSMTTTVRGSSRSRCSRSMRSRSDTA